MDIVDAAVPARDKEQNPDAALQSSGWNVKAAGLWVTLVVKDAGFYGLWGALNMDAEAPIALT